MCAMEWDFPKIVNQLAQCYFRCPYVIIANRTLVRHVCGNRQRNKSVVRQDGAWNATVFAIETFATQYDFHWVLAALEGF